MPIEYETVTIKVPKLVMDLLRFAESVLEESPIEFIEYVVVENVKAGLLADEFMPSAKYLADKFNLNPIFKELVDEVIE